ncbi:MAG: hypothetical protein AAF621_03055 [Pseudomonadota bacterium]
MSSSKNRSSFVNTLTELYLASATNEQKEGCLEGLIDIADDMDYPEIARRRVTTALLLYRKKNPVSRIITHEINALVEKNFPDDNKKTSKEDTSSSLSLEKKMQKHMRASTIDTKTKAKRRKKRDINIIDQLYACSDDETLAFIIDNISSCSAGGIEKNLAFYLGHIVYMFETGIVSKKDIATFWQALEASENTDTIKDYMQDYYDIALNNLTDEELLNIITSPCDTREDIVSDWLLYMQEFSDKDIQTLEEMADQMVS